MTAEQAVTGVRGTDFRVTVDGDSTASEVLEGKVRRSTGAGAAAGKSAQLPAGFGSKASADGQLLAPVQLLPAPELASTAALQERLVVRLNFRPLAQVLKYRAQVSRDQDFYQVVAETVVDAPRLRFGGLDDGPYFLRVRGIDVNGTEGRDALLPFTLKARPRAAAGPRRRPTRARCAWRRWSSRGRTSAPTPRYRMQIARDAAFTDVVFTSPDTPETKLNAPATLPLGDYFWRIRTIEGQDTGPWSDVRSFHLLPPPAVPEPPQIDARRIRFSWTGEPGQTFVFQVARDAQFTSICCLRSSSRRRWTSPSPRAVPTTCAIAQSMPTASRRPAHRGAALCPSIRRGCREHPMRTRPMSKAFDGFASADTGALLVTARIFPGFSGIFHRIIRIVLI